MPALENQKSPPWKKDYSESHCYQYDIRIRNYQKDLSDLKLSLEEIHNLKVTDCEFSFVPSDKKSKCLEVKQFIERHEWLGKMPTRPTHRFIATYKGHLAGVVVMATPNSFSNLLGKDLRHLEKLISRGACISWSPKNLASALVMFGIRWMVKRTPFRFFTAYSDTEAWELGIIYQACNFIYLGQTSGAKYEFFDPGNPNKGPFSDRQFRKTSQIKRYAKELGITWVPEWSARDRIYWKNIPGDIALELKAQARLHQERCQRRRLSPKHKYVYILGSHKKETAKLRQIFKDRHPNLTGLPYPKMRGPQENQPKASSNTAVKVLNKKENILTEAKDASRPQGQAVDSKNSQNQFLTIKEVAQMMRTSEWSIYNLIKKDPGFPFLNIGVKKKLVVDRMKLMSWIESRANERAIA